MSYFHLRYDYKSPTHLERFIDFVRRIDCTHRLIVLEKKTTNQKDHLHCIFTDRRSKSMVRQDFLKKFPDTNGKVDKDYQLKEIPENELYDAEKYLCKGDDTLTQPNIVLQTGKYTVEFTVKAHADYWELNVLLNANKKPVANAGPMDQFVVHHRIEKVVKPKKNFYSDVIDYLHLQWPDKVWTMKDTPFMLTAILKLHGKHFRPYGPQQVENEMNVIMNILVFDEHYTHIYDTIKARGNIPNL